MFLRRFALLKARKFNVAVEVVLNFRILALNFSRYPKFANSSPLNLRVKFRAPIVKFALNLSQNLFIIAKNRRILAKIQTHRAHVAIERILDAV